MSRAARARDDDFQTAIARRFGVFKQQIRRPVSRDDARFERDPQTLQRVRRGLQSLPI